MGRKAVDLTGRKFNRLTVARKSNEKYDGRHAFWECDCICGNKIIVRKDSLISGHSQSCGCYLKEKYNDGHLKTHGMSKTKIYKIWIGMKSRCYVKSNEAYSLYGGRGIKMCNQWLEDFMNFYAWSINNGYDEVKNRTEQSIDRIDVDGNYEPSNCRWADCEIQNYNKRDTQRVVICGKSKTLLEISREYGVPISTLRGRYQKFKKGIFTVDDIVNDKKINTIQKNHLMITVDGETKSLAEWERVTGVNRKTISRRFKRGITNREDLFRKTDK